MRNVIKYILYTLGAIALLAVISVALIIIFLPDAPIKKAESIINQRLGFSAVDNIDVISNKIVPLSYDLIATKYPTLKDKTKPNWHILTPEQYISIVEELNTEFFSKVERETTRAHKEISSIEKLIADNDALLETQAADYRSNCINQVNYNNCAEMLQVYEKNKVDIPKTKGEALASKVNWLKYISEVEKLVESEKMKPVNAETQDAITFVSGDIYLKYFGEQRTPAEYLKSAVHESLHALSANPNLALPSMWEEGLTDFFALQVINKYVDFPTDDFWSAYPLEVKLVRHLLAFTSEQELLNAYMIKDESFLKKIIDQHLGDGFYNKILIGMNPMFYNSSYQGGFESNPEIDAKFGEIERLFYSKQ